MNLQEVLDLPAHEPPVLCLDGKFGMLIRVPGQGRAECGVQVHGEEDIRWIGLAHLHASPHGALREHGARMPSTFDGLVQQMLALEWARLGGMSIRDEPVAQATYARRQKFSVNNEYDESYSINYGCPMKQLIRQEITCLACRGRALRNGSIVRCTECGEAQDLDNHEG